MHIVTAYVKMNVMEPEEPWVYFHLNQNIIARYPCEVIDDPQYVLTRLWKGFDVVAFVPEALQKCNEIVIDGVLYEYEFISENIRIKQ